MNPALFLAENLLSEAFLAIRVTYLGDERWMLLCGNQHHCVDNFTFESTSLELFASGRECSGLFTGERSGL